MIDVLVHIFFWTALALAGYGARALYMDIRELLG